MTELFACWVIFQVILSSPDFFFKIIFFFFVNFFREYYQSVKQFGSISGLIVNGSGLVWVQAVCKGFQQTILVGKYSKIGRKDDSVHQSYIVNGLMNSQAV